MFDTHSHIYLLINTQPSSLVLILVINAAKQMQRKEATNASVNISQKTGTFVPGKKKMNTK